MRHFTIATAGHVDHGKSTLVRALTGIDPDRLIEEQRREMTIDLGFAYLSLPNGDVVGIIDVPGHIDFIENMLAGVGGIDAALLIVAADEGPMPQTREHLAILDLLDVRRGVVALTKTDLAPDPDWVPLVSADVRALLAPTPLRDAQIVPVSARQGSGLSALVAELARVLRDVPPPDDRGAPRLPIDRVFTIAGFGTVVTGTLLGGPLAVGDEIEILPAGLSARVRGLQTHKQKIEQAQPGSRVAVNLTGVTLEQVRRGHVLARPGLLKAGTLLDARVELRSYAGAQGRAPATLLRHNQKVKLFAGAAEVSATALLLDGAQLTAGAAGWVQFALDQPLAVARGDRFILRLPSPSITLGGGVVADASPPARHRRRGGRAGEDVIARLDAALRGSPAERLAAALRGECVLARDEAAREADLEADEIGPAIDALAGAGMARQIDGVLALDAAWAQLHARAAGMLDAFHKAQPLAPGMPRETLRSRLGLSPRAFGALLAYAAGAADAALADDGETVRAAAHRVQFSAAQQRAVDMLLGAMRAQPWNTPLIKDCRAQVGDAVFEALLRQRALVAVSDDVVFLADTYADAIARVRERILRDGQITAAQVRDGFGTSRKYALALLEHLDQAGVTRRVGDARVLRQSPGAG